jgi:radical SAM protein with 4Fe4S-binding SPASM domain
MVQKSSNGTITYSKIFNAAAKLLDGDKKTIILSGGEPTLCDQMAEIANRLRREGYVVGVSSCGAAPGMYKKLDKEIIVQVSIHAADENLHDKITGKCGSYNRAFKATDYLMRKGHPVYIKTVITKQNVNQIQGLGDNLLKKGIKNWVLGFAHLDSENRNRNLILSLEEIAWKSYELQLLSENWPEDFLENTTVIPLCLAEILNVKNSALCPAGKNFFAMHTNGSIGGCHSLLAKKELLFEIGDDLDRGRIYRNFLKYKRSSLPGECMKCSKFKDCEGGCLLLWQRHQHFQLCKVKENLSLKISNRKHI